ncbi:heme-degrading domain-containing protein [Paenibacillus foliorum]|nr:heme-degrading domain-containing protein [Paenibacillus foliorum]
MEEDLAELLKEIDNEEKTLQFKQFTNLTAYELGIKLVEAAIEKKLSVTIDICRGEQQLFHYALPGTTKDNDEWIKRKNRIVNRFYHSSYYMRIYYKLLNTTIQEKSYLDPSEYAAYGGAFPIHVQNVGVIGTITVSGLPQKEDHKFVVDVLKLFLV